MEASKLRIAFKKENNIDAIQTTRHAGETTYSLNYVHWLENKLLQEQKLIDWMQSIMTKGNDYCEIYLAGLRQAGQNAESFQFETNPDKIQTLTRPTLREAIIEAMNSYFNEPQTTIKWKQKD